MDIDAQRFEPPPHPPVTSTTGFKAGIAVAAAAVAAILIAAAALLLKKRRRRLHMAQEYDLPVKSEPGDTRKGFGVGDAGDKAAARASISSSVGSYRLAVASDVHHTSATAASATGLRSSGGSGSSFGYFDQKSVPSNMPSILSSNLSKEEAAGIQLGR
jgi:hypothetical protein